MRRKAWVLGMSAVGVAVTLGVAWGGIAQSSVEPIPSLTGSQPPPLQCNGGLAIVMSSDFDAPRPEDARITQKPRQALAAFLSRTYPTAPSSAAFQTADSEPGAELYEFHNAAGALKAMVIVDSADDESFVHEVALCESTAKGWSK
jgi:hypothetical protein